MKMYSALLASTALFSAGVAVAESSLPVIHTSFMCTVKKTVDGTEKSHQFYLSDLQGETPSGSWMTSNQPGGSLEFAVTDVKVMRCPFCYDVEASFVNIPLQMRFAIRGETLSGGIHVAVESRSVDVGQEFVPFGEGKCEMMFF